MAKGTENVLEEIPPPPHPPPKKKKIRFKGIEKLDEFFFFFSKLLEMGVTEISQNEKDEATSPIFIVPKPDGTYRSILNLKEFNQNVKYEHFKSATRMLPRDCFMASVDLNYAYYSVPVAPECKNYEMSMHWSAFFSFVVVVVIVVVVCFLLRLLAKWIFLLPKVVHNSKLVLRAKSTRKVYIRLNTNFNLSATYSFHKSLYHKSLFLKLQLKLYPQFRKANPKKAITHVLEPIYIPRALNTGICLLFTKLFKPFYASTRS